MRRSTLMRQHSPPHEARAHHDHLLPYLDASARLGDPFSEGSSLDPATQSKIIARVWPSVLLFSFSTRHSVEHHAGSVGFF